VAYTLSAAAGALFLYLMIGNGDPHGRSRRPFSEIAQAWVDLLRHSLPVGYATLLSQFVVSLPLILIGIFSSAVEVGNFSAAWKVTFFLLAVDRGVYFLFYPLVARTHTANPDSLPGIVDNVLRYTLILVLPLAAVLLSAAGPIIAVVFGSGYAAAAPMLRFLSIYFIFTVLNSIFTYVLIAIGKETKYSTATTIGSVAMSLMLFPLVFAAHGNGAAAGMALGELAMMAGMYRAVRGSMSLHLLNSILKPGAAAAAMGIAMWFLLPIGTIAAVAVGCLTYAGVLLALRAVSKNDLQYLKERFV
jgi:O-antigen/teichoic acid export membrane protein